MALAELGGGVAVELERHGQRRAAVGPDRGIARRGRGQLGDAAHADRVVVAASQQRRPGGRAERSRMKAVVLEAMGGQPLGRRRVDGAAKCAGRGEAGVVDQHDQDVGRAGRRPQRLNGRELRLRILSVVLDQPGIGAVRDRQDGA